MSVLVRYWAGAKAAAGVGQEQYEAGTLAALLDEIRSRHTGGPLPAVLARCSYLVDEVSPGTREPEHVTLAAGSVVEVLPPFAGGAPTGASDRPRRGTPVTDSGVRLS